MSNVKIGLRDINTVDLEKAIECIEERYNIDDLEIVYWEDEEARESGDRVDGFISTATNMKELIKDARYLVKSCNFACVEIIDKDEKTIYFYDYEDEMIGVILG